MSMYITNLVKFGRGGPVVYPSVHRYGSTVSDGLRLSGLYIQSIVKYVSICYVNML